MTVVYHWIQAQHQVQRRSRPSSAQTCSEVQTVLDPDISQSAQQKLPQAGLLRTKPRWLEVMITSHDMLGYPPLRCKGRLCITNHGLTHSSLRTRWSVLNRAGSVPKSEYGGHQRPVLNYHHRWPAVSTQPSSSKDVKAQDSDPSGIHALQGDVHCYQLDKGW